MRGGVQKVTCVLADYFEKKGNKVFFISFDRTGCIDDERQYYLPDSGSIVSKSNCDFFTDFLKKKSIDIVINQGGIQPKASELAFLCKKQNIRLISVIHTSPLAKIKNFGSAYNETFKKHHLAWLLPLSNIRLIKQLLLFIYKEYCQNHYRNLCKLSDRVFLLSDKFKPELLYLVGDKLTNVIGMPNPLPVGRKTDGACVKDKEVLYVGRIENSEKRVDLLLHIWSKLEQKYPDWKLRIVGSGGDLDKIKSIQTNLKLKNVFFEGFQSPLSYYESSPILTMTSSYEGFGMVLIEGMSCGAVPIAFSSFLSVTDIIDDNKNGMLVTPFNVDEYVFKLEILMTDNQLRANYAKEAVKKSATFDLNVIGEKWLKIMQKLIMNKL